MVPIESPYATSC